MPIAPAPFSANPSHETWPPQLVDQSSVILGDVWFAQLSTPHQEQLLSTSQTMFLAQGEVFVSTESVLMHDNDPSQCRASLFLLLEGRLSIECSLDRVSQKNSAFLGWLSAGQWWFEMEQTSMANAELAWSEVSFAAQSPCELRVIKPASLQVLLKQSSFLLKLMQLQATKSRDWLASLTNFHMRSTLARTAHRLWLLCLHSDKPTGSIQQSKSTHYNLAISQNALANLLGVTRQSLIHSLQELATRQLIIQNYGRIQVINLAGLVAIFRA